MNLNIGLIIKMEMERQEHKPSWLAKKIYCDRTNIHKIYNKSSIDTNMLYSISKALDHNFFEDLSEHYKNEPDCILDDSADNTETVGNCPSDNGTSGPAEP